MPHWSPSTPLNCRIRLLHSAFPGIKSLSLSATIARHLKVRSRQQEGIILSRHFSGGPVR
ncbi:hypothetical protein C6956_25845 [Escherichia coli]|nr:hypothetical protein C6956_25845 [Escherichia coli]